MQHLYRPLLRPASFASLPSGIKWQYVEAPRLQPIIATRLDIPLSRYDHGVISTDRELTKEEQEHFDLKAL